MAPKRGRTQAILAESKKGLGEAYDVIKKSPDALIELPPESQQKLLTRFGEIAEDMPSSVKEKVAQDFADFVKRPITGESLMSLHKKINKSYSPFTLELGLFKGPIKEALTEISPELGQKFQNINNLYSRHANIAGKLKPTLVSDLVSAAEAMVLIGSIVYGDVAIIGNLLKEQGVRIAAGELLLNPHLNQLGEKFLLALNQHKWGLAAKITSQINDEIKEMDKSAELQEYSEEDLRDLFGG